MQSGFFDVDDYYTGPPVTPQLLEQAQDSLGVRLPFTYVELLRQQNGGVPLRRCFMTDFETSWAPDHFEISALLGIGGESGIDCEDGGSAALTGEWGYPDIGVGICDTPSGGHDAVMLDYRGCGALGEPSVAYIDEDRIRRQIASAFSDFLARLVHCAQG